MATTMTSTKVKPRVCRIVDVRRYMVSERDGSLVNHVCVFFFTAGFTVSAVGNDLPTVGSTSADIDDEFASPRINNIFWSQGSAGSGLSLIHI